MKNPRDGDISAAQISKVDAYVLKINSLLKALCDGWRVDMSAVMSSVQELPENAVLECHVIKTSMVDYVYRAVYVRHAPGASCDAVPRFENPRFSR